MKRLSPWNPLDHLRLLWWVLVTPHRLVVYRETYEEGDEYRVGKWLISALAWLPLFLLIVALQVGTVPHVITDLPITYCGLGASVVLTWALVNYFKSKSCGTSILAFIMTSVITFIGWVFVLKSVMISKVDLLILIMIVDIGIGLTFGLALSLKVSETITDTVDVVAICFTYAAVVIISEQAKLSTLGAYLLLIFPVTTAGAFIGWNLNNNRLRSTRVAFGGFVLAYFLLIWFIFLGGWRVFV